MPTTVEASIQPLPTKEEFEALKHATEVSIPWFLLNPYSHLLSAACSKSIIQSCQPTEGPFYLSRLSSHRISTLHVCPISQCGFSSSFNHLSASTQCGHLYCVECIVQLRLHSVQKNDSTYCSVCRSFLWCIPVPCHSLQDYIDSLAEAEGVPLPDRVHFVWAARRSTS